MNSKKNKILSDILKIFKNTPKKKEDILELLRNSVINELLDAESMTMIEGVFKVSEMQVREIMIPRPHMKVIDISDNTDDVIKKVTQSGHSRFPVIDDNKDDAGKDYSFSPQ